ncbi:YceI family protein [Myxococcota bacterium]|nr:YceI family protein [Myxococcota bacterium]
MRPALPVLALAFVLAATAAIPAAAAPLKQADARIDYHISHPFKDADGWLDAKYIRANLDFDAEDPAASKMSVVLDATGFSTGNELRDSHQQEQIGASTYKTVKFQVSSMVVQSKSGEGAEQRLKVIAYGKMQFHGVLKDVSWPIDAVITPTQVVVDSAFTLDITHFGMEPKSVIGIAVAPEVPVKVHMVFAR